jgi:hypothetical protein
LTTLSVQSRSATGDGEVLAGGASDKKVNWAIFIASDGGEVPVQRHVGIVVGEDGARRGLNLAVCGGLPPERLPSDGAGADASAYV